MMKLIVTVVEERDVYSVLSALTRQHISVTHISSTGSFLDPGNSTLLIGVDEDRVPQVMKVVADVAGPRQTYISLTHEGEPSLAGIAGVVVGSYVSFVLEVDHFEQV